MADPYKPEPNGLLAHEGAKDGTRQEPPSTEKSCWSVEVDASDAIVIRGDEQYLRLTLPAAHRSLSVQHHPGPGVTRERQEAGDKVTITHDDGEAHVLLVAPGQAAMIIRGLHAAVNRLVERRRRRRRMKELAAFYAAPVLILILWVAVISLNENFPSHPSVPDEAQVGLREQVEVPVEGSFDQETQSGLKHAADAAGIRVLERRPDLPPDTPLSEADVTADDLISVSDLLKLIEYQERLVAENETLRQQVAQVAAASQQQTVKAATSPISRGPLVDAAELRETFGLKPRADLAQPSR